MIKPFATEEVRAAIAKRAASLTDAQIRDFIMRLNRQSHRTREENYKLAVLRDTQDKRRPSPWPTYGKL